MSIEEIINQVDKMLSSNDNNNSSGYSIPEGSILGYNNICTCDDLFMCDHRKKELLRFLKIALRIEKLEDLKR